MQIVIIFSEIIHEYPKAEKQVDSCNRQKIVKPR